MIKNLTHEYGKHIDITRGDMLVENRPYNVAEFNKLTKQALKHLKDVVEADKVLEVRGIL